MQFSSCLGAVSVSSNGTHTLFSLHQCGDKIKKGGSVTSYCPECSVSNFYISIKKIQSQFFLDQSAPVYKLIRMHRAKNEVEDSTRITLIAGIYPVPSVPPSISLTHMHPSIHPFIFPFFHPSICPSAHSPIYLLIHLSNYSSICTSSICPSIPSYTTDYSLVICDAKDSWT